MVSSRYCLHLLAQCLEKKQSIKRYKRVLQIHLSATRLCRHPLLYDFKTNHGLITDNSLLQCALTWPADFSPLKDVLNTVSSRVERSAVYFISPDGVPLEPATSYWYLIRRLLNDLKNGLEQKNIKLSEQFLIRLKRLDSFLAETNMEGLVQRFGDSALGNNINLPFEAPPRAEGATLHIYDTGLILFNVVQAGRVVAQFMVNAQNIHPRVHAQDDAGAIAFYARETFWINSPGSYTAMNKAKRKIYTHYSNQSGVWHSTGYAGQCKISSIETNNHNILIRLLIGNKIERSICFSRMGFNVKITDQSLDKQELTAGMLLSPECTVEALKDGLKLLYNQKEIFISSLNNFTISIGYISYRRNEVIETKSLRATGHVIETQIHLPELEKIFLISNNFQIPASRFVRNLEFKSILSSFIMTLSIRKLQLVLITSLSLLFVFFYFIIRIMYILIIINVIIL
jgi:hypothetical protein